MKQRESWILMLGYPNIPMQAKRLYWLLDRVANKDWVVVTTNTALSKITGKGVEMIGQYLRALRIAGLLEILEIGRGRNPSRYHLLPPNPNNLDYKRAVKVLKNSSGHANSSSKSPKPQALQTKTIGSSIILKYNNTTASNVLLDGSGLNKKDSQWLLSQCGSDLKTLGKYIKDDPSKRSKKVNSWNTWDFIYFARWLYQKTFNKPCLVLSFSKGSTQGSAGGKVLTKIKSGLIRKFDKHGLTKAHAVVYLLWLFREKRKDILELSALAGIIASAAYQQGWIDSWISPMDVPEPIEFLETPEIVHCLYNEDMTLRPWEKYWDPGSQLCMLCPHKLMCEAKGE